MELKVDDVLEGLKASALRSGELKQGVGSVTIVNGTPIDWGLVIIQAATKFFYSEGGDYTDSQPVHLVSGQSITLRSGDPGKCVQQWFTAIMAQLPGESPATYSAQDSVPNGQCLVSVTTTLGQQTSTPREELTSKKIFLELKRTV